ncbi:MAG: ABC transporter substrate-binding protein [Burkholderiales bacterium]
MDTRRDFLGALGAGAMAAVFPAIAQPSPFRVAWTSPTRAEDGSLFLDELRRGLQELGYVEGRNLVIEQFWAENSAERMEKLIAEVVASRPHVIVAQGATAVAMRRATTTIPVVFGYSGDPVEAGLVESLRRPGRNLTGISYLTLELVGKRMELLKEVLPSAKRVAVVANPQHPGDQAERRASQAAATALGMSLEYFEARNAAQLAEALTAIEKSRSDAVMMFPVQNIINSRERIAAWSIKNRLPTISGWAQFAEGGNLISYGPNLRDACRRLAVYVGRILKGTKPAELPVELPTRVELIINMRTARALGITIPPSVLVRADRVIE